MIMPRIHDAHDDVQSGSCYVEIIVLSWEWASTFHQLESAWWVTRFDEQWSRSDRGCIGQCVDDCYVI